MNVDFGPLRVNSGYVGDDFWTSGSRFRASGSSLLACERRVSAFFSNLGPLGVDFWCLVVKLKTLGIAIRPLSVLLIVEGVMCFGAISSYVGFSWALRNANETSLVFKIFQKLHNY